MQIKLQARLAGATVGVPQDYLSYPNPEKLEESASHFCQFIIRAVTVTRMRMKNTIVQIKKRTRTEWVDFVFQVSASVVVPHFTLKSCRTAFHFCKVINEVGMDDTTNAKSSLTSMSQMSN